MRKHNLGKQIWFNEELWDIVEIISPTKYDHYILIKIERNDQIHCDTKTRPVEMRLIDCGNNEFYPNSKEVAELIKNLKNTQNKKEILENKLCSVWADTVDENNLKSY